MYLRRSFALLFVLTCTTFLFCLSCQSIDPDSASSPDDAEPDPGTLSTRDDDPDSGGADENFFGDNDDDSESEEPLGDNPALGYGSLGVKMDVIYMQEQSDFHLAYIYMPLRSQGGGPYPTLIWGHGLAGSYNPDMQAEIFLRHASRGFLVIFPNMDVPLLNLPDDAVLKSAELYLHAAQKAVDQGLADPDRIIFGGFSYGARVAALAAAMTTRMDAAGQWPDPAACVFEAMPDFLGSPIIDIPGPLPSQWAHYIDPAIPLTILCAAEDKIVPTFGVSTEDWVNGAYFFSQLRSDFAQLIILNSGSTVPDTARHNSFLTPSPWKLDALDLWGHMKVVFGLTNYHFNSGHRAWAYGLMRSQGGWDRAGQPIVHEVWENHQGQITQVGFRRN